jgi:hypothetical protein
MSKVDENKHEELEIKEIEEQPTSVVVILTLNVLTSGSSQDGKNAETI